MWFLLLHELLQFVPMTMLMTQRAKAVPFLDTGWHGLLLGDCAMSVSSAVERMADYDSYVT